MTSHLGVNDQWICDKYTKLNFFHGHGCTLSFLEQICILVVGMPFLHIMLMPHVEFLIYPHGTPCSIDSDQGTHLILCEVLQWTQAYRKPWSYHGPPNPKAAGLRKQWESFLFLLLIKFSHLFYIKLLLPLSSHSVPSPPFWPLPSNALLLHLCSERGRFSSGVNKSQYIKLR